MVRILLIICLIACALFPIHAQQFEFEKLNGPSGMLNGQLFQTSNGYVFALCNADTVDQSNVYLSRTNGQTWTPAGKGMEGRRLIGLTYIKPGEFLAATKTGLFRSTDDGISWRLNAEPLYNMRQIIQMSNGDLLAIKDENLLLISSDNGASFDKVPLALETEYYVDIAESNAGYSLLALKHELLRSTDNGRLWSTAFTFTDRTITGFFVSNSGATGVAAVDSRNNSYFYLSDDSGLTWTEFFHCSPGGNAKFMHTATKRLVLSSRGLLEINDGSLSQLQSNTIASDVELLQDGSIVMIGSSGNGIKRSFDEGKTLIDSDSGISLLNPAIITGAGNNIGVFGPAGFHYSCPQSADVHIWRHEQFIAEGGTASAATATANAFYYGLTDKTSTGKVIILPYGSSVPSLIYQKPDAVIAGIRYHPISKSVYVLTDSNSPEKCVLAVSDSTQSFFTEYSLPSPWIIGLEIVAGGDVYLCGGAGVYHSPDGGKTIAQISSQQGGEKIRITNGVIYMIGKSPEFDDDVLMVSADQGATWSKQTAFSFTLNDILVDSAETVFLATTGGVLYTRDNGITWNTTNLTENTTGLSLDGFSRLLACAPNSGIYRSKVPTTTVGISSIESTPSAISLSQCYPNPVSGVTSIGFELHTQTQATVSIYNSLGVEVARVYDGIADPGMRSMQYNTSALPAGVYRYVLRTSEASVSKVMTVAR